MKKIKVKPGYYVKSIYGNIDKIEKVYKEGDYYMVETNNNVYELEWYRGYYIDKIDKDIKKLIEVGDIVGLEDANGEIHYYEIFDNPALYQYDNIRFILTRELLDMCKFKV